MMGVPQIFSSNPLDRGERERRDEAWIDQASRDEGSKFLPLWNLKAPLSTGDDAALVWLSFEDLSKLRIQADPVLLGLMDGAAHFAIDVSELENGDHALLRTGGGVFEDARNAAVLLSGAEAGVLCQAAAQINWHGSHGFCSACGHETEIRRGGQMRQCPSCQRQHFPRTDPVVITVVSHEDKCLLGQSRGRMSRLKTYSALAGFVDQGESIEEAVAREIMEEAGLEVNNVRYLFSQPWPFPHTLMIGCHADAVTTEIKKDDEEMEAVGWFSRQDVRLALEGENPGLMLPGPIAIAHHLIRDWAGV